LHFTTHLMTGAAWGYVIGRPVPAALSGVGWHMMLDMTPHRDPDHDISYVVDGLLGAAVLATVGGSKRFRTIDRNRAALWGAIGAGLPDTELLLKLFKNVHEEDYYFPTHNGMLPHRQTYGFKSTVTQAAFVVFSLAVALVALRRRGRVRRDEATGGPSGVS